MNRFTVVWGPDVEATLAEIWTNADDRDAVTAAANAIDSELANNPLEIGSVRRA